MQLLFELLDSALPGIVSKLIATAILALIGAVYAYVRRRRTKVTPETPSPTPPSDTWPDDSTAPPACPSSIGLADIQKGSFLMGSSRRDKSAYSDEWPRHKVRITRTLYVGKSPVTQGLWEKVMGTALRHRYLEYLGNTRPVVGISWFEAIRFCNEFSKQHSLSPVYRLEPERADEPTVTLIDDADGYRLLTEAEWEYVTRAGTKTMFWAGDDIEDLTRSEWWGIPEYGPAPTMQKPANPWGLYDTNGNVAEWCWDWYGPYQSGETSDPRGPELGTGRVFRGGRWFWKVPRYFRSADRDHMLPVNFDRGIGFRVCRERT